MSEIMKTYRKPDGYTIKATPKAFGLFYEKQGFMPVEDKENTTSRKEPAKAETGGQAETPEKNVLTETPEEKGGELEEKKPASERKKAAKKNAEADSVSGQPVAE